MTRIKICGITRPEDGRLAARLGVDALGLVFYDKSPRAVTLEQARKVVAALPPFVTVVGLFVDPAPQAVAAVLEACPIDVLQFHGDESPEFCRAFHRPYIKAVRMRPGLDLSAYAALYADARGLLVDAFVEGVPGGTGQCFDWRVLPQDLPLPLILSGGLDERNVAAAVRQVQPAAVDVSSGVEQSHGVKDAERMQAFVHAVRSPG